MSSARFAEAWWEGRYGLPGAVLRMVLAPASWLWGVVTYVRNRRFDRGEPERVPGARVISVGNLAVGGTGKTPFASWAARTLASDGRRPAIVLSGYGADEVALHRSWAPDLDVVADRDRVAAARRVADAGADAVVVDDAFQHRRLGRDVDLVLLSVEDRFPGRLLPCGPYREPASALARADAVVLTRRSASVEQARALARRVDSVPGVAAGAVLGCVRLSADALVPLVDAAPDVVPGRPAEVGGGPRLEGALAVTAIARPRAFLTDVARRAEGAVELKAFRDHHDFTEADARAARLRAGRRPIVVTEKDAVKLRPFAAVLGEAYVLRQRLAWDWGEADVRALLGGTP